MIVFPNMEIDLIFHIHNVFLNLAFFPAEFSIARLSSSPSNTIPNMEKLPDSIETWVFPYQTPEFSFIFVALYNRDISPISPKSAIKLVTDCSSAKTGVVTGRIPDKSLINPLWCKGSVLDRPIHWHLRHYMDYISFLAR